MTAKGPTMRTIEISRYAKGLNTRLSRAPEPGTTAARAQLQYVRERARQVSASYRGVLVIQKYSRTACRTSLSRGQ